MEEYLHEKNGTSVIGTKHFMERMQQRMNGMSEQHFKGMLDSILQHYHTNKEQFDTLPYNSEIFFFSPKYQRGMVLAHRRDSKNHDGNMHFILMTVYPYGKAVPVQQDTPKITVH